MSNTGSLQKTIAHVDMNTFFVSVERLNDPGLEGLPVVVGGNPDSRSVVSAASYEARQFGIHSAMPMAQAVKLCPDLVIVRGHFKNYIYYNRIIKGLLKKYTPILEMTSIDEGYLDLTGTAALWGPPGEAGRRIRQAILDETGLPSSIGISSNKLVSKVASDLAKPAGDPRLGSPSKGRETSAQYLDSEGVIVVPPGSERDFLAPLTLAHIPGCGKVTTKRLASLGLTLVRDVAQLSEHQLAEFGEQGRALWKRANGIGSTRLHSKSKRKSISKEITFSEDVRDRSYLRSVMHQQAEQVATSMRRKQFVGRTVTIKIRFAGFETHTAAKTLPEPTDHTEEIFQTASDLLTKNWAGLREIRLIGVGVTNFISGPTQEDLFEIPGHADQHRRETAIDTIRERFGSESLLTGESINLLGKRDVRHPAKPGDHPE
jgi:DNA polymerase-4